MRCKAGRGEGDDLVTRSEAGHVRTTAHNMTTALHAECRSGKAIFESFFRQQAKCPHHIAEIETAGFNGDFHVLAFKRLALNGVPGELVQGAWRRISSRMAVAPSGT